MNKLFLNLLGFLLMGVGLTACSTWDQYFTGASPRPQPVYAASRPVMPPPGDLNGPPHGTMVASSSPTGERGLGQGAMDAADRTKLSHALDKTPGKSTQWVNESSGISYTVVPTRKMTINDNPYCRAYNLTATRGGKSREMSGTACVSSDGSWQGVR